MSVPRWSDGAGVATIANSNVIGGIPVVHIFDIADAATANYDIVVTYKTEIYDVTVVKTATAGVAVTAQVKNGTSAITDAMSIAVARGAAVRPVTIDDTTNVIAAGGTLRVAIVRTTSGGACRVFVHGVRRA